MGHPHIWASERSANAAISPLRRRKVRGGFGRDDRFVAMNRKQVLHFVQDDIAFGLLFGGFGLNFREDAEEVAAEDFFHLLGGVAAGHEGGRDFR
jgi:hypothetical protein